MLLLSRFLLLTLLVLWPTFNYAQKVPLLIQTVSLPKEIADRNNQFSGLYAHNNQLLLLSESRLQEQAEAKVYALDLASLEDQLARKSGEVKYRKYAIQHLDKLRARIDSAHQHYEGLEGLTVVGSTVYFTVETATPSTYCYLLKGELDDATATIRLDTRYLVPLPKPVLTDGSHIYNAGFEALTSHDQSLLLLFEYNYFSHDNYAFRLPQSAAPTPDIPRYVPVARLPFRVTDLVHTGRNRFTAINYFYNGADDSVYRTPAPDPNARLIRGGSGYQNYCRLISLRYRRGRLSWKPLFELPREYMTYNWEGLAAYKGGYFLINDKYGPSNQSTLLYLRRK